MKWAREMAITVFPRCLESQFIFFYDMKLRIIGKETAANSNDLFHTISVADSPLANFYFSDNFPEKLIVDHFHGSEDRSQDLKVELVDNQCFVAADRPLGNPGRVPGYNYLEGTLFKNGLLALTLRLQNRNEISDVAYVDLIARPEYVRQPVPAIGDYDPGQLVEKVWQLAAAMEQPLADYLSSLEITAVTVEGGVPKPLRVWPSSATNEDEAADTPGLAEGKTQDTPSEIWHRLRRSRPFVGTIIDFADHPEKENASIDHKNDRIQRLAIACGRTTPEFLQEFSRPDIYLNEEVVEGQHRNIYHPGPNIIFVARRGWACLKLEKRDTSAFQMGVIETVLFAIQAVFASVRATRRFLSEIVEKGQRDGLKLNAVLSETKRFEAWRLSRRDRVRIYQFTAFMATARLNSPLDDMHTLLGSHITTHTGISAVARAKNLSGHDELIQNARQTMANFGAFLDGANQYWTSQTHRINLRLYFFAILAVCLAMIGVIVALLSQKWVMDFLMWFAGSLST